METHATQRAPELEPQPPSELGPQSASIRILNGRVQGVVDVSAWAKFGEVKFFNEDFEDYLVLLSPKAAEPGRSSVALTLLARDSVSFTSPNESEFEYDISLKSNPIHLGKKKGCGGGGTIRFDVIGGPVKGGKG